MSGNKCETCHEIRKGKERKLFMKLVYIRMLLDENVAKGKQTLTMMLKNDFEVSKK